MSQMPVQQLSPDLALDMAPFTERDLTQIMAIEQQIYPFPWTIGNFRDALKAGYEAWAMRNDSAQESSIVGYAMLMYVLDEAHLLNLSVAGRFQRAGNGRRLLNWLMRTSRRQGAASMILEVRPSNLAGIALYENQQFVPIGKRPKYYPSHNGQREDALVMRRSLKDLGEPDSIVPGSP